jgi:hypothetical protein
LPPASSSKTGAANLFRCGARGHSHTVALTYMYSVLPTPGSTCSARSASGGGGCSVASAALLPAHCCQSLLVLFCFRTLHSIQQGNTAQCSQASCTHCVQQDAGRWLTVQWSPPPTHPPTWAMVLIQLTMKAEMRETISRPHHSAHGHPSTHGVTQEPRYKSNSCDVVCCVAAACSLFRPTCNGVRHCLPCQVC